MPAERVMGAAAERRKEGMKAGASADKVLQVSSSQTEPITWNYGDLFRTTITLACIIFYTKRGMMNFQ